MDEPLKERRRRDEAVDLFRVQNGIWLYEVASIVFVLSDRIELRIISQKGRLSGLVRYVVELCGGCSVRQRN